MNAKLDMIGIVVADMPRALAFYRELGLEFADDADSQPHVETTLPGGLRLGFDTVETVRSFDPDWSAPSGSSRIHLAFHCETPAGVDSVYERLVGQGHTANREPWDAFWGQRYAVVDDPDGNGVDLFAPLD
jgi:catechol 2,3-dioxygenase-like lactoylglutathione lyase family enzyme